MSRTTLWSLAAIALAGVAGCASGFVATWKEPLDAPFAFQGERVAAIVIHPNDDVRRAAENELARELSRQGAQGIAAYMLYQGEPPREELEARRILRDANVDGALVLHPVDSAEELSRPSETETPWYTGAHYARFWSYWAHAWEATGGASDPETGARVHVETMLYSVEEDALLWAARSESTELSEVGPFMEDLAGAAAAELRKAGFIS